MLKEPGFLETRFLRWLTRAATVTAIEDLTPHFRLVDLQGEALKDHVWVAGQKMQMQLGGFVSRTYTPMSWDNDKGHTRFLAYIHGDAPASRWASALKTGDTVAILGPRHSLDLSSVQKPLVLFGDENFVRACPLARRLRHRRYCIFIRGHRSSGIGAGSGGVRDRQCGVDGTQGGRRAYGRCRA